MVDSSSLHILCHSPQQEVDFIFPPFESGLALYLLNQQTAPLSALSSSQPGLSEHGGFRFLPLGELARGRHSPLEPSPELEQGQATQRGPKPV